MRSLLFILVLLISKLCLSHANGQNCLADCATLKSRIEVEPEEVLFLLGDAIALSPDCVSDLMETAIRTSKPNSDTLTQMIRLAVTESPEQAASIAQAAVLAAPDQLTIIQQAFRTGGNSRSLRSVSKKRRIREKKSKQEFFHKYETPEFDGDDVANQALQAIDELIAKVSDQISERVGREKAEVFRMSVADHQLAVSTINDPEHHDRADEWLQPGNGEPLTFKDQVIQPTVVEPVVVKTEELVKVVRKKPVFFSSVYPVLSESLETVGPIRRNRVVSPTSLRLRLD